MTETDRDLAAFQTEIGRLMDEVGEHGEMARKGYYRQPGLKLLRRFLAMAHEAVDHEIGRLESESHEAARDEFMRQATQP